MDQGNRGRPVRACLSHAYVNKQKAPRRVLFVFGADRRGLVYWKTPASLVGFT